MKEIHEKPGEPTLQILSHVKRGVRGAPGAACMSRHLSLLNSAANPRERRGEGVPVGALFYPRLPSCSFWGWGGQVGTKGLHHRGPIMQPDAPSAAAILTACHPPPFQKLLELEA